jgi:hypothetical protein
MTGDEKGKRDGCDDVRFEVLAAVITKIAVICAEHPRRLYPWL